MSSRWFQCFIPMHTCLLASTLYPHQHPQPAHNHHHHGNIQKCSQLGWHISQLSIIGLSCTHKDGYKVQEAFMHGNNEDKKKAIFFAIACAAYCLCLCHSWYMVLPQTWPCDPLPWALIGGNSHCPFTDAVDVAACHISLVWAFSSCLTWLCSARGGVIVVLLLLVLALDQLSSVYCEHLLS